MSIAGFRASNHPQQTSKRGASDAVDDRGTDPAFIASLEERFGPFNLDAAASPHNAKCSRFFTVEDDGLAQPWGEWPDMGRVWCNPPYSTTKGTRCDLHESRIVLPPIDLDCGCTRTRDLGSWVDKAWTEWHAGNVELIAMLVPANRTEQGWWQDHVEPYLRDAPGLPLRVEFLRGRMRFHRPDWQPGPKGDRPPFGCALLIWEKNR